jgi:UDP-N-acetylmuramoyl-L-alanyl-D-glutamate--2,6-diaminopimelate ligase
VLVRSARQALAEMSAAFFGHPEGALKLIGVTGTNGKTTVAHLIAAILAQAGEKCGVLGTVGVVIPGRKPLPLERTTPESYDVYKYLALMRDNGCTWAALEVTSHALTMDRVHGLRFEAGVFTNLTRDHLDFLGTESAYLEAKSRLFDVCRAAVLNFDDPHSARLVEGKNCYRLHYSIQDDAAELTAKNVRMMPQRVEFEGVTRSSINRVSLGIPGRFSVYNALAAMGCALAIGVEPGVAAMGLRAVRGIPGRAEIVPTPAAFTVMIDFAHTPDSVENILKAARGFTEKRIIAVLGCGGNRDKTKRPMMAKSCATLADVCGFTSDNPRGENPRAIIEDMLPGAQGIDVPLHIITDRKAAIGLALTLAQPGDTVLLLGKGHETYQEIDGKKHHLDEREVVADWFSQKHT